MKEISKYENFKKIRKKFRAKKISKPPKKSQKFQNKISQL